MDQHKIPSMGAVTWRAGDDSTVIRCAGSVLIF